MKIFLWTLVLISMAVLIPCYACQWVWNRLGLVCSGIFGEDTY